MLVTHQLQYLKDMKHVVLMNSGEVEAQGPFHTLAESGHFTTLQQPHHEGDRQRQKENNASSADAPSAVPLAEGQHTADSAQFRSTLDTDSSQTQKVDSVANNGIEYDSIGNIDINSKAETHKMTVGVVYYFCHPFSIFSLFSPIWPSLVVDAPSESYPCELKKYIHTCRVLSGFRSVTISQGCCCAFLHFKIEMNSISLNA